MADRDMSSPQLSLPSAFMVPLGALLARAAFRHVPGPGLDVYITSFFSLSPLSLPRRRGRAPKSSQIAASPRFGTILGRGRGGAAEKEEREKKEVIYTSRPGPGTCLKLQS